MNKQYFRVLNESEEPAGAILDSKKLSSFRQEVHAYRMLSHDIYTFASSTSIQIQNAVRVAQNAPVYLDELNKFFESRSQEYTLMNILVDDPIKTVTGDQLYAFVSKYISHINETELYYDWGKNHYLWEFIWEMIRYREFRHLPSRMDSTFLFTEEYEANKFLNQYRRGLSCRLVKIELLGGLTKEFDMNWFTDVPSDIPMSEAIEYARNYWSQNNTPNPNKEILYVGQYKWFDK